MRFRRLFRALPRSTRDLDDELREEIESHVQMCADALERKGLSRAASLAAARERFGDFEHSMRVLRRSARQRSAQVQRRELLHTIGKDLAFAVRQARRAPGFSAAVILTLALGMGANAAMFGIVDRMLISPPPGIHEPGEVRRLYWTRTFSWAGLITQQAASYDDYARLRNEGKSWSDVAAHFPGEAMLGRGESARPIQRNAVTASYWSLLRPRVHIGRVFTEQEDAPGNAAAVAVLGYHFWRSAFGADSGVLGKRVVVGNMDFTVVGVAAPEFTGADLQRTDVWVPMSVVAPVTISDQWQGRGVTWLAVLARLRPGVSDEEATAEATLLYRRALLQDQPRGGAASSTVEDVDPTARAELASIIEARGPAGSLRRTAQIAQWLAIMAFLVLVIATTNVASLILARASARQREVAVRAAMGASVRRLAGLLLAESTMYAAAGCVAGFLLAVAASRAAQRLLLPDVDWGTALLGQNVLLVSAVTLLLVAALTSIAPILQARRASVVGILKAAGRGATLGKSRARSALILAQAALSVLLLCGAGLFVRSLHRAVTTDLGFDAQRVILTRLALSGAVGEAERSALGERLVEIMKSRPDVEGAALTTAVPFHSSMSRTVYVSGRDSMPRSKDGGPYVSEASPGFFRTVGTPLLRGRAFDDQDRAGAPLVAIISETMERMYFPGEDALGRCIQVGSRRAPCTTVVGIARDARRQSLEQPDPVFQYYLPLAQRTLQGFRPVVLVRPKGDPQPLIAALRKEAAALSPNVSHAQVHLLQDLVDPQIRPWRLGAGMFAGFGVLALLIAGVGLYSVLAYEVTRRGPEFGIRLALGASAREIVTLVLKHGVALAVGGVLLGLVGAAAAGRFIAPLLYRTSAWDPGVIVTVCALLLLTALASSISPALRARSVDPNAALKDD